MRASAGVRILGLPIAAALICLTIAGGPGPAAAQPFTAQPVDEAGEEPALEALRDRLLDAVRRRDTDAVVALAEPDIALSFGGHFGTETLRRWLEGEDGMAWTGPFYWQQLEDVLERGGMWWHQERETDPLFCAPYVFFADYPEQIDPFHVVMIIREDAPLHSGPGLDHPVIATLSYDIAEIIDNGPGVPDGDPAAPYWLGIRTADGAHEGYVVSTDFRSPIDYRACFRRDPGSGDWVWDTFIAGD